MKSWQQRKAKMNFDSYIENHQEKKYIKCCDPNFFLQIIVVIGFMFFAGLMNGLTLAYMSMNRVDLEVLLKSGASKTRIFACMSLTTSLASSIDMTHVILVF